ncbi:MULTISPECIES: ABC transporter substrate-binding protein [unclassified Beijerinckia]|uniref:ABC transporter substrate-binding protein n=1 Tax=unclassified Beijerinckia TaxID=2638183 RepID=UPI00089B18F3|nr:MULTISPECIES: ABC transporter substrate-binding protein [unclassified Beijerinckia]MDH7795468.1 sulfonate transport system substrate-binding protein [Beijerinckia sp. GAS462]SEC02818.1 sulfonate transport system substrate-binding protein [Beijerinckia sp. 28-YEA-48]
MLINRRHFTAALASLSSLALARPSSAQALPSLIRFGDVGFGLGTPFGQGILSVADAKGFIAKEFDGTPVKVQFTYFTGTGPAINEALANSQLDFASYGSVPNAIGKANGLPTKLLLSYGGTNMFAGTRPDLPIRSIADLKGKRVTLQKATILHWGLIRALQEAGLSEKDVTIVDLKNADQFAAIAAKSVDAIFGASYILPLREKGIINLFYNSRDLGPRGSGFGAILSTDDFAKQYPEATTAVLRGILRADAYIADEANRDEVFKIWSRTGTPFELFKTEYEGLSLKEAYNPLIDEFFYNRYRSVLTFNKEQKLIRNDIDLNAWVDDSFLTKALEQTGLQNFWPQRRDNGSVI